jgi:hypothetical protein
VACLVGLGCARTSGADGNVGESSVKPAELIS